MIHSAKMPVATQSSVPHLLFSWNLIPFRVRVSSSYKKSLQCLVHLLPLCLQLIQPSLIPIAGASSLTGFPPMVSLLNHFSFSQKFFWLKMWFFLLEGSKGGILRRGLVSKGIAFAVFSSLVTADPVRGTQSWLFSYLNCFGKKWYLVFSLFFQILGKL